MPAALQPTEDKQRDLITFSRDQIDLIKKTMAKGATDDELKLFLYQAQRKGLDPLDRQIYFQKRKNRKTGEETVTILTAIDGYRLIADRTGKYAGNDDPVFDNEDWPRKATVTVYKMVGGVRCQFTATARWDQYYPGDYLGFMWNKMPHLMLGKCAEALALRKAFPAELSGVYVKEELDQSVTESDVIDAETTTAPDRTNNPDAPHNPTEARVFDPDNRAHQDVLVTILKSKKISNDRWYGIAQAMRGKPSSAIDQVLEELKLA